jgi:hypothetical protein
LEDCPEEWLEVDLGLRRSIEVYKSITINLEGKKVIIFLDYIIRLTIMRAYANTKQNKVLTAEKIIGFAETMIPVL